MQLLAVPKDFVAQLDEMIADYIGDGGSENGQLMAGAIQRVKVMFEKHQAQVQQHPIDKHIPMFWTRVGLIGELASEAHTAGHSVGTSNWGAHVIKGLYSAFPVDEKIAEKNTALARENMGLTNDVKALRNVNPAATYDTVYKHTGYIGDANAFRVPMEDLKALQVAASRWVGMTQSSRIRIIGCAGVHETEVQGHKHHPNFVHFGAEFWTRFGSDTWDCAPENLYGNTVLARYADAAYAEYQIKVKEAKHEASVQAIIEARPHGIRP